MVFFKIGKVSAHGIRIFNPYHGYFLTTAMQLFEFRGCTRKTYAVRAVGFTKPVDGFKFLTGVQSCAGISVSVQGILPGINNKPPHIQASRLHFWKVYLGGEVSGIIEAVCKIFHIDIYMSIQSDYIFMDLTRSGGKLFLAFVFRGLARQEKAQAHNRDGRMHAILIKTYK